MGKFSPTKVHGDCEEIANPSTAYGRRRRNWTDAHGSVPESQVVDASCGNTHCITLKHAYLRPRVEQPGKSESGRAWEHDCQTGLMPIVLGFDVYGTLVDPFGIEGQLESLFPDSGLAICALWRQKQLEYSFRRGLMRCYEDFDSCTNRALSFAVKTFKVELPEASRQQLLTDYLNLPPFSDVLPALKALNASGCKLLAFSNGVEKSLRTLLGNSGVLSYFEEVVSVDDIKTFKPNPDVYAYLVNRGGRSREETWLVSSNSFDVIGAKAARLKAAWVRRHAEAVFDPWEFEPDIVVSDLTELASSLGRPADRLA